MTRGLTFNELAVESQYLLKLQSVKVTKIPRLITAKCPRQMSCCQSLDAFSRVQVIRGLIDVPVITSSLFSGVPVELTPKLKSTQREPNSTTTTTTLHPPIFQDSLGKPVSES